VFGYGIVVGGGSDDLVTANRVSGNPTVGILVGDLAGFQPARDTVKTTDVSANGTDLALTLHAGGPFPVAGTCFAANTLLSSLPPAIDTALPSGGGPSSVTVGLLASPAPPPGVVDARLPAPPVQPSMPGASTAQAHDAIRLGAAPDRSAVTVPAGR